MASHISHMLVSLVDMPNKKEQLCGRAKNMFSDTIQCFGNESKDVIPPLNSQIFLTEKLPRQQVTSC